MFCNFVCEVEDFKSRHLLDTTVNHKKAQVDIPDNFTKQNFKVCPFGCMDNR